MTFIIFMMILCAIFDDKYKTEAFCIDNIPTPHEWFKEDAISEEEITGIVLFPPFLTFNTLLL